MKRKLINKLLISFVAVGAIGIQNFTNTVSAAVIYDTLPDNPHSGSYYTANDTDGILEIKGDIPNEVDRGISGIYIENPQSNNNYAGNAAIITGGSFKIKNISGITIYKKSGVSLDNVQASNNYVVIDNANNAISFAKDELYIVAGAREEDYANIKATLHNNSAYINNFSGSIDNLTGAMGYYVQNNRTVVKNSEIRITWDAISGGYAGFGEEGEFANSNTVEIINSTIKNDDTWTSPTGIAGGFTRTGNANDNKVFISGDDTAISCNIYGGYSEKGAASNNSIILKDKANLSQAEVYGGFNATETGISNNKLFIDGWSGQDIRGVYNFSDIYFQNIEWKSGNTVLNITDNTVPQALSNTELNCNNLVLSGGAPLKENDSMTLIAGQNLGIIDDNVPDTGKFTAGVAVEGTAQTQVADDGNSVTYTLTSVKHLDQINLVAENRAVAAAFINQGTDLINDSLDVLSRDSNYGLRTFAAVHGNRSKYDVNSDLKINGWSTIVGIGNKKKINGGDFSWGVFYENGSGNYRTYNEFNNEFFRGDGSLVYNGGGIAARFERDNGVYTEGSLRAGMLKSEMTNALKDGVGNSYGYKSESTYYGAHIGVGRVIRLNEAADLDVYGKFFHTYTEGDSFNVAGDKFEFDSITSDRLRIGARLTTNKKNKFSTYYGLAYEYEFNGDANMKAQNMSAPEQSLKGSSCMAEIGTNYKPSIESPWSLDLSMRGYAGQRDGFSGNVQVTYSF